MLLLVTVCDSFGCFIVAHITSLLDGWVCHNISVSEAIIVHNTGLTSSFVPERAQFEKCQIVVRQQANDWYCFLYQACMLQDRKH